MRHTALGRHAPPSRKRIPLAACIAVAVVIIAVLTTVLTFLATSASAVQAASAKPDLPASRGAVTGPELDKAVITAARDRAAAMQAAAGAAKTYTVRPGDSISRVAASRCGAARDWTGIYQASRAWGWTAWNANQLAVGQRLRIFCAYEPSMLGRAWTAPAPRAVVTAVSQAPARQEQPETQQQAPAATYQGSSSMQQCIIARESGGQSQIMNSSGHYGLFQFDYSTWVAGGGAPADFGHASVAEQNRVFWNTVAARGYSPWTPYDGC